MYLFFGLKEYFMVLILGLFGVFLVFDFFMLLKFLVNVCFIVVVIFVFEMMVVMFIFFVVFIYWGEEFFVLRGVVIGLISNID